MISSRPSQYHASSVRPSRAELMETSRLGASTTCRKDEVRSRIPTITDGEWASEIKSRDNSTHDMQELFSGIAWSRARRVSTSSSSGSSVATLTPESVEAYPFDDSLSYVSDDDGMNYEEEDYRFVFQGQEEGQEHESAAASTSTYRHARSCSVPQIGLKQSQSLKGTPLRKEFGIMQKADFRRRATTAALYKRDATDHLGSAAHKTLGESPTVPASKGDYLLPDSPAQKSLELDDYLGLVVSSNLSAGTKDDTTSPPPMPVTETKTRPVVKRKPVPKFELGEDVCKRSENARQMHLEQHLQAEKEKTLSQIVESPLKDTTATVLRNAQRNHPVHSVNSYRQGLGEVKQEQPSGNHATPASKSKPWSRTFSLHKRKASAPKSGLAGKISLPLERDSASLGDPVAVDAKVAETNPSPYDNFSMPLPPRKCAEGGAKQWSSLQFDASPDENCDSPSSSSSGSWEEVHCAGLASPRKAFEIDSVHIVDSTNQHFTSALQSRQDLGRERLGEVGSRLSIDSLNLIKPQFISPLLAALQLDIEQKASSDSAQVEQRKQSISYGSADSAYYFKAY